jgi:hypothetical protein
LQITLVRDRITCYQGNSLTPLFQTIIVLAKNIKRLVYELTFANTELYILRVANKVFSKRHKTKKIHICQGNILIIEKSYDIITQDEINKQIRRNKRSRGINREEGNLIARRYSTCGKTSHNTRTCQEIIDISSSSDSEE